MKKLLRKWLIEETGEIRRVKQGEHFIESETQSIHFVTWNNAKPTTKKYPIVKAMELVLI